MGTHLPYLVPPIMSHGQSHYFYGYLKHVFHWDSAESSCKWWMVERDMIFIQRSPEQTMCGTKGSSRATLGQAQQGTLGKSAGDSEALKLQYITWKAQSIPESLKTVDISDVGHPS